MRVLHIHSGNLYGGVETLLVTLARHRDLAPEMESHFALCFKGRLSDAARGPPVQQHMSLVTCGHRQPLSVWRARRVLRDSTARTIRSGCLPFSLVASDFWQGSAARAIPFGVLATRCHQWSALAGAMGRPNSP